MDVPQVSVVIPAYNESRCIAENIQKLADYFSQRFDSVELIVVDDGSTDNTSNLVEQAAAVLPGKVSLQLLRNTPNRGKGYSIRRGGLVSLGTMVLFTDADLAYDLPTLERIAGEIENGADLAIGSRVLEGSQVKTPVPFLRSVSGRVFNFMVQALLFRGVSDTQCGVKGFSRMAVQEIFPRLTMNGFSFDVEILYIARKLGFSIREVPATLVQYRNESRVHILSDSWKMMVDLLTIRRNGNRGDYLKSLPQEV